MIKDGARWASLARELRLHSNGAATQKALSLVPINLPGGLVECVKGSPSLSRVVMAEVQILVVWEGFRQHLPCHILN